MADEGAEEKLLEAIEADPTDDTRLVYADWLEEHGEHRRAEYVRLELRLHRLELEEARDPIHAADRDRLEALERRLDRGWLARVVHGGLRQLEPERATISLPPPPPRPVYSAPFPPQT